jgi:flavin reductase (DIM6/NTAB) family NADH-FMN oxidoreductase RutF
MSTENNLARRANRLADAMRQLPGGVCIITAGVAPNRTGYTGTAVFSLSVDPERVVISVGRSSSSYPVIRDGGFFGLNILSADQQEIADRFAGRGGVKGEARFNGADWVIGASGASLLVGALAALDCRVEEIIERHSHAIIVGEPLSITTQPLSGALVYWRSRYVSTGYEAAIAAE